MHAPSVVNLMWYSWKLSCVARKSKGKKYILLLISWVTSIHTTFYCFTVKKFKLVEKHAYMHLGVMTKVMWLEKDRDGIIFLSSTNVHRAYVGLSTEKICNTLYVLSFQFTCVLLAFRHSHKAHHHHSLTIIIKKITLIIALLLLRLTQLVHIICAYVPFRCEYFPTKVIWSCCTK